MSDRTVGLYSDRTVGLYSDTSLVQSCAAISCNVMQGVTGGGGRNAEVTQGKFEKNSIPDKF